jgi:ribosomal protein S12 methylthiotransferase accessory factor
MGKDLHISNLNKYCFLEEDSYYNDEPLFFSFKAIAKISPINNIHGTGTSFIKHIAIKRALGEALERFALIPNKNEDIIYEKYLNIPQNKAVFSQFTLLTNKNHLNNEFMNKKLGWVMGNKVTLDKNILNLEKLYIPAQLVFVPYNYSKSEPLIQQPISTGAVLQTNFKKALISGILEIFERDSYILSFYTHTADFKLDLSLLKDIHLTEILNELERNLLEYHFINISKFKGIYIILCILFDKSAEQPRIVSGMGTNFNIKKALIKSIEEALQLRPWLRDAFSDNKINKLPKSQIADYFDRVAYWNLSLSLKIIKDRISFYLNLPSKQISKDEYNANLTHSTDKKLNTIFTLCNSLDFEVFCIDRTPDFLKNKICVIKVIIPQAQPFFLNEKYSFLSKKRLASNEKFYTTHPHFFL